jgi:hypothetical protein
MATLKNSGFRHAGTGSVMPDPGSSPRQAFLTRDPEISPVYPAALYRRSLLQLLLNIMIRHPAATFITCLKS